MLPKVTITPEKNSKSLDSESKANKEDEKPIDLEFNTRDKFAETLCLKWKEIEESNSKLKENNTKSEKKEDNKSLHFQLVYKSNEKTNVESNIEGDIYSKVQNSMLSTEKKIKEHENKRKNNCDENAVALFNTAKKNIKSLSPNRQKNVIFSDSESSEENQSAKLKKNDIKSLNNRIKRKKVNIKDIKFKPKRRRISSDSSDCKVQEENKNLEYNFKAKDDNTKFNNELTNVKVETEAKKHILEKKFNDELNSKSISKESKNSESDTRGSAIIKSDLESNAIEDDEDWNHKPGKMKLQNIPRSKLKLEKYHNNSESNSESIDIVNSKTSNSESEKVDSVTLKHKFYRKKSQKSIVNKQHENSEFDSIEVASSKTSDSESEEVDKKYLGHKFYSKKFQRPIQESSKSTDSESTKKEENISTPLLKLKVNKKQKKIQSNSIKEIRSNSSDSESEKIDNNILNHKSQKRKSQDNITFVLKPEVSTELESNSKQGTSNKILNSKFEEISENADTHKSHINQLHDKLITNMNRKQKILETDSVKVDISKASDSESKEINQIILNENSRKSKSRDNSSLILSNNLDKKQIESQSDSVETDSSKNSESESEKVHQNILSYKYQQNKTCDKSTLSLKTNVDRKLKKVVDSDSIEVASNKASDSESEERNENTLDHNSQKRTSQNKSITKILTNNLEKKQKNSKFDSVERASNKISESESEEVDKNIFNCKSQKRNLKNKSYSKPKKKLRNSESDTIDVVNTENSNSEVEKGNKDILKHKSLRKKSKDGSDLKVKKLKNENNTVLAAFFRNHITENKHFETSNVSDFILKSEEQEEEEEEEDYNIGQIDTDEEDDKINISNVYAERTSYWPTHAELMKLKLIQINLKHSPPPQHCIEKTSGTRNLSKEEKLEFEKYVTLRHGTFKDQEDKILKKNWKTFCKLYDWDVNNPKPFLHMKYKNKKFFLSRRDDRMKFVQFLANGLFDRSLYSVYQRFKVIFDPHKVSRYKPDEDSIILDFMKKNAISDNDTFISCRDRKWADLALILRRTRASVWRRYQILQKKNTKKNVGIQKKRQRF